MKTFSKNSLAVFLTVAGTLHFILPDFYLKIMPPYLPWPLELVYVSGFIELALGLLLHVPRCSRWAAWGVNRWLLQVR